MCLAGGELAQHHPHPVRSDLEEVVMFRRVLLWSLLVSYLIVVALWPSAAAPIELAIAGLATVLATVPGPVWALAAGVAWLKYRPAPKPATT